MLGLFLHGANVMRTEHLGRGFVLFSVEVALTMVGMASQPGKIPISRVPFLAAIGASMVTRTASRQAFFKAGRSVVTEDMIPEIGKAFATVFGEDLQEPDKGKL